MRIEVNGKRYLGFTDATADVRIDTLSNSFSFTATPSSNLKLPFALGDECVIFIDNEPIITGYIEIISGSGDESGSEITITGRDKTSDILDSSIGALSDISTPILLKRIIEIVIDHIGADIDVIDLTDAMFTKSEDIISPEPGDNAFEFLEKIARKKNVILSSNSDGNIVIQRSIGETVNAKLIHKIGGLNNNILRYNFSYDNTGRFNKYSSIGNLNICLLNFRLAGETSTGGLSE
ncbi:MAG TPA: hypothetical protein PLD02_12940, partial [Saprospiraceae bacterium]|nr:hypothetical protein [Saprospiraceae bacterium]